MQNQPSLSTFNTNPYLYTQPQPLPTPIVSAQQAPVVASQNFSYPLNATNTLTGQGGFDSFNASSTANNLQAPFVAPKPSTTAANNAATGGNSQIQLDLNALLNPNTQAVTATAPVMENPFANAQATTIPGFYPNQPGQKLNITG